MRLHLRHRGRRGRRRRGKEHGEETTHSSTHPATLRTALRPVNRGPAMVPLEFDCVGERLQAWPSGALHWPARALLAVADLHLEKGSSYAVNALKLLPRHDTRQTLLALGALIEALQPRSVICLGDSFHDRDAHARLPEPERREIARLSARARFVWIAGNHDPAPPPADWGEVAEEFEEGPLLFRHEARFGPADGEISGHFHPVAALSVRGRGIRRRCFLTDGRRVILPALGAYAGGLNALDPAIAQLFPDDYDALVVGRDAVRRLSRRQLRPDASYVEV
jgi:DNA ligase-associated metallophosphoesterase